jgi:hypothetical protein
MTTQYCERVQETSVQEESNELKQPLCIATDAEWQDFDQQLGLAVGISINGGSTVIFLNNEIFTYIGIIEFLALQERTYDWAERSRKEVYWTTWTDSTNLIEEYLNACEYPDKKVKLRMYYSPTDLHYCYGFDNVAAFYSRKKSKRITQKRNIKGRGLPIGTRFYDIHDLKGWSGKGGLKGLAETVGYKMSDKNSLDDYKDRMLEALVEKTDTFLDYLAGDCEALHTIHDRFEDLLRHQVCKKILGVELVRNLPETLGALDAKLFESWLLDQDKSTAFKLALRKLGLLNPEAENYKTNIRLFNELFRQVKSIQDVERLEQAQNGNDAVLQVLIRRMIGEAQGKENVDFQELAYSQASVRHLAKFTNTIAFNALVQGGRCNNERTTAYTIGIGADIDLKSCYGTSLTDFNYFIGLPSLFGYAENEERMTLGDWFKKWEKELIPGAWTLTVSGNLLFCQDLIYSKLVNLKEINQSVFNSFDKEAPDDEMRDNDVAHIPGIFVLLKKKIQNGIITHDIWQAIKAIATNKEMSELNKLDVVCAAVYKKSDCCNTTQEWTDRILADTGSKTVDQGSAGGTTDTRTTAWIGINIGDFISPLVRRRGEIKTQLKEEKAKSNPDADQISHLEGLDSILKLVINTLYGVLASPFFPIGNTVVANNITARARLGVWMLNKALHTRLSITDGGPYSPIKVPFLSEGKKPGLEQLSDNLNWIDQKGRNKNRTIGMMGGIDWTGKIRKGMTKEETAELAKELDKYAKAHIDTFWANYELQLPFNIEHKGENTFVKAAYWNKAHYAFDLCTPQNSIYTQHKTTDRLFRIRGCKQYSNGLRESPIYKLLSNILDGSDEMPEGMAYDHFYLLKIPKWLEAQKSNGYASLEGKRPGDAVVEQRILHLNNTHLPVEEPETYLKRSGRRTSKTSGGQKRNIEFFEKYRHLGIAYVHKMMLQDKL